MSAEEDDALEGQVTAFLESHSGGERIVWFSVLPAVASGLVYAVLEVSQAGKSRDVAFVILLCAATVFLAFATVYFRCQLCHTAVLLYRNSAAAPAGETVPRRRTWCYRMRAWRRGVDSPGHLLELVFDRTAMATCGLAYGILLGSAPLIVGVYENNWRLRGWLMAFLFCANLITGAALYTLVMTLRQCWHLAKRLDITFFRRTTKAVQEYSRILTVITVSGAVYIGLCQMSAIFSHFGGLWVCGYAMFAIGLYICMYYLPQMPIRRRLAAERDEVLLHINEAKARLLQQEVNPIMLNELARIHDTEDRVMKMGVGLSATNASLVELAAVIAGIIPLVSALIRGYAVAFAQ